MASMHKTAKSALAATLLGSLLLAACGGGSDSTTTTSGTATSSSSSAATTTSSSSSSAATTTSSSSSSAATTTSSSSSSAAATTSSSSSSAATSTTAWLPTFDASMQTALGVTTQPASGTNTNFPTASTVTVDSFATISTGTSATAGFMRLYYDGTNYFINFNGGSYAQTTAAAVNDTLTTSSLTRYIAIPYTSSNTASLTVKYLYTTSSTAPACTDSQVAILDSTGKVLAAQTTCSYTSTAGSLTATAASASNTQFYVVFSRVNAGGGGVRVSEIDLTK